MSYLPRPTGTSAAADALSRDRPRALSLLKQASLPVPECEVVRSEEEALAAADDVGLPVVVRPCRGLSPKLIRRDLRTDAQVAGAYHRLALRDKMVLVEKHVAAPAWRLLVVGEQVVSAVRRGA